MDLLLQIMQFGKTILLQCLIHEVCYSVAKNFRIRRFVCCREVETFADLVKNWSPTFMWVVFATSQSQGQKNGFIAPPQRGLVTFPSHHATVKHYVVSLAELKQFHHWLSQPKQGVERVMETRMLCKAQNLTILAVALYKQFAFSTFSKFSPTSPGSPLGKAFVLSGAGCMSSGQFGTGIPLVAEAVPHGGAK